MHIIFIDFLRRLRGWSKDLSSILWVKVFSYDTSRRVVDLSMRYRGLYRPRGTRNQDVTIYRGREYTEEGIVNMLP